MTGETDHLAQPDADSPLVWLQATGQPRGLGGPTYGTTYDLSKGCPRCGTGSTQLSPLFLRPTDAPQRSNVWQTLDSEVLLAPDLKSALDGVTGVELRQALSSVNSQPLPWFQVIPLHELPPMAPTTIGIYQPDPSHLVAPCPQCHRDAYFTRMTYTIRYELDLADVPDVSHTYEQFGRSVLVEPFAKSHFARPLAIIRRHVYARLIGSGAKDIAARSLDIVNAGPVGRDPIRTP
jgi:hypothetical protein